MKLREKSGKSLLYFPYPDFLCRRFLAACTRQLPSVSFSPWGTLLVLTHYRKWTIYIIVIYEEFYITEKCYETRGATYVRYGGPYAWALQSLPHPPRAPTARAAPALQQPLCG